MKRALLTSMEDEHNNPQQGKETTKVEVSLEIIVRSTEIDVNGHVNNAKYLSIWSGGGRNGTNGPIFPTTDFWPWVSKR